MLELNSTLKPFRLKKVENLVIKQGTTFNKGTAIVLINKPVQSIQNSIFYPVCFRYFYQNIFLKDYFLNKKERVERVAYKEVLSQTPIVKCPINTGLLNNNNYYFDISREFELLVNNSRAKTRSNRLSTIAQLLNDTINNIKSLGYSEIIIYVDSDTINVEQDSDFVNNLFLAMKYGWFTDTNFKFKMLIGSVNTPTLLIPEVTVSKTPTDIAIRNLFKQRLSTLITTSKKLTKPIVIDNEEIISQNTDTVDGVDISDLDAENSDSYAKEGKKYDKLPDDVEQNNYYYVVTNNPVDTIGTQKKLMILNRVALPVFNKVETAIQHIFNKKEADLVKIPLSTLSVHGTLSKAGYKLCRLRDPLAVKYLADKRAYIDASTIVDIIPSLADKDFRVGDDFIVASAVYDSTNIIKDKLLKKLNAFSSAEQLIFDELVQYLSDGYSKLTQAHKGESISVLANAFNEFNKNPEVTKYVEAIMSSRTMLAKEQRNTSLAKELETRSKDTKVTVHGKELSIGEVLNGVVSSSPGRDIPIKTPLKFMQKITSDDINRHYVDNMMVKDMVNIANSFNNEFSEPAIFITDVKIEDTSDEFNYLNRLKFNFAIPGKAPQEFKLDFPALTADGYLFTNGTKKFINNQVITVPITYIKSLGENSVQFTTNYNKVFIEKIGQRLNSFTSRLVKSIIEQRKVSDKFAKACKIGSLTNYLNGLQENTTLHIKEIASSILSLEIKNIHIDFDARNIAKEMFALGYEGLKTYPGYDQDMVIIGFHYKVVSSKEVEHFILAGQDGKIYYHNGKKIVGLNGDVNDQTGMNFDNYLYDLLVNTQPGFDKIFKSSTAGKRFMYSSIKAIGRKIPLVAFIGWRVGLSYILDKYHIDYEWSIDKTPSDPMKYSESIRFKDKYLHYAYTVKHGLILNGLQELDSEEFTVSEFEARGNAYKSWFISISSSNLGKAIDNFYSVFIDPITREILDELKIPSTLADTCLYCNTMLEGSVSTRKNNMDYYRIRGYEAVVGMIYKIIGDTVNRYRNSASTVGAQAPLTVKVDTLLKELSGSPILEELKLMNPNKEARNRMKSTYKGPAGINFASAKGSEELREYSKSMVGSLTPTTMDSDLAGITRFLSMNPMIYGQRGIIRTKDVPASELNAGNILNIAELLSPFTPNHADSPRFGMQLSQAGFCWLALNLSN